MPSKLELGPSVHNAEHMRSFLAVVETGSQVRAGKLLGIAPTTVARHIFMMQEHYGHGLFEAGQQRSRVLVRRGGRAGMACALQRGGHYDEQRDKWTEPPRVDGLHVV